MNKLKHLMKKLEKKQLLTSFPHTNRFKII